MAYEKEILTATLTITGGVMVFVLGQVVNEIVIKPVISLKKEIGKVTSCLTYYGHLFNNPTKNLFMQIDKQNASNELRRRAGELKAKSNAVPTIILALFFLPSRKDLTFTSDNLIILSNTIFKDDYIKNYKVVIDTEKRLKIKR